MTTTKVTTLSDLFWIAANEYLAEPQEIDCPAAREFSCVAVIKAAEELKVDTTPVYALLEVAGISRLEVGWHRHRDTHKNNQLARYTFLLFLSLYCEDEGI